MHTVRKVLLLSFLLSLSTCEESNKKICRALALSGGANKGSYQIGVVKGLTELLPPEEVQYDVVSGVSTGSINAGGMSRFPVGTEKEMVEFFSYIL